MGVAFFGGAGCKELVYKPNTDSGGAVNESEGTEFFFENLAAVLWLMLQEG